MKIKATIKGRAFMCAVRSGLIQPREDGKISPELFEKFWDDFNNDLANIGYPDLFEKIDNGDDEGSDSDKKRDRCYYFLLALFTFCLCFVLALFLFCLMKLV